MSSSAGLLWCSSCKALRSSEDFGIFKSGKPRKLCLIHQKKRKADTSLDSWDLFVTELSRWNHPVCYANSKFSKERANRSRIKRSN